MENYTKGEVREVEEPPVFSLDETGVQMRVTGGSKLKNLMGFAMKKIKEPCIMKIAWNGSGNAVTKTVSCAEIMKRRIKGLHQITKVRFRRVEEYWEPKIEGLERLKVNKDIPAISILLSKDELDKNEPGYQAPGSFDEFWKEIVQSDKAKARNQQNSRSSGGPQTATGFTGSAGRRNKKFTGKDKSKPNSAKKGDNKERHMSERKEENSKDKIVSEKQSQNKDKRTPNSATKKDNRTKPTGEKQGISDDAKRDASVKQKETSKPEKMETDS